MAWEPLMERLKAEINEILEQAITWWGDKKSWIALGDGC